MSKIKEALVNVSGIKPNQGEAENAFLIRVVSAVSGQITDAQWDSLPPHVQDWNNAAAEAVKNNSALPPFPDAEAAPPAAPRGRGRTAAATTPVAYVPAKGDMVKITTKRGGVKTGVIVDLTDVDVVINKNGADGAEADDEEFVLALVTVEKADATGAPVGGATVQAEPEGPLDPSLGDTVEVITKRDKVVVGNVVYIEGDELGVKDASGADHDFVISTLKSVKVKVAAAGAASSPAPAPAPSGRGRGARADRGGAATEAPADAAPATRTRSRSTEGAPSLGMRIRQIVCASPEMSLEALSKQLTAENMQFRDASVKLVQKDTLDVINVLKGLGKLK